MRKIRIHIILFLAMMLITLISCTRREDTMTNDNQENKVIEVVPDGLNKEENNKIQQMIKVALKSISQEEYNKWVVPSNNGYYDPYGLPLQLPELKNFNYPYVEGMEDKELQNKVNETIKTAIFNEDFFSGPMCFLGVETTPWSEFEFPGIISNKNILSIPIVLYWNREKSYYKSISVTIDMKTGERLFLEDIIKLNEEFTYKLIYEDGFFYDKIEDVKDYLYNYFADARQQSEASKRLLDSLRGYVDEDKKPEIVKFYLTKDGLVLTEFTDGIPWEINIPLKNLQDFLKIKSWEQSESIQVN